MMRAGAGYHVLFDHDAADIIAAEAQPKLADFESRCHPRRLDIQNIVQVNSGKREHLQILDRGRFLLHKSAEGSVFTLEKPGNKRSEATRVFLNLPNDI